MESNLVEYFKIGAVGGGGGIMEGRTGKGRAGEFKNEFYKKILTYRRL